MVEVVEDVEGVPRRRVGVRVVGRRRAELALVVELDERALAGGVVVDHVQDHRDAALVRLLHELLEGERRAVVLVEREVEARVVAPRLVPVVLGDGHELDGVHAEPVEVVERVGERLERVVREEVAHEQLVHHEVLGVGPVEGGERERLEAAGAEEPGHAARLVGVGGEVGPDLVRDEAVGAGVEHERAVRVGDAELAVDEVLEGVVLAWREPRDLAPPPRAVGRLVAEEARVLPDGPPVEVAQEVDELLSGGVEAEGGARAVLGEGEAVLEAGGPRLVHHVGHGDAVAGRDGLAGGGGGGDGERAGRDGRGQHAPEDAARRVVVGEPVVVGRAVYRVRDVGDGVRGEEAGGDGEDLARAVLLARELEQHRVRHLDHGVVVGPRGDLVERVGEPGVLGAGAVLVVVDLVRVRLADCQRDLVAVLVEVAAVLGLARRAGGDLAAAVRAPVVERARHEGAYGAHARRREVRDKAERHVELVLRRGAGRRHADGEEAESREGGAEREARHGSGALVRWSPSVKRRPPLTATGEAACAAGVGRRRAVDTRRRSGASSGRP